MQYTLFPQYLIHGWFIYEIFLFQGAKVPGCFPNHHESTHNHGSENWLSSQTTLHHSLLWPSTFYHPLFNSLHQRHLSGVFFLSTTEPQNTRNRFCRLCGSESPKWPLKCLSSDGPCPESRDDAHLWPAYGEDKTANHLLQHLSDPLQLRGLFALKEIIERAVSRVSRAPCL